MTAENYIPPTYVGQTVYFFVNGPQSNTAEMAFVTSIHSHGMCNLFVPTGPRGRQHWDSVHHYSDPWFKDLEQKRIQWGYWTTIPASVMLASSPGLIHEIARAIKDPANYASEEIVSKVREYLGKGHSDTQIASYLKRSFPLLNMAVIQQIRAEECGIPRKIAEAITQNPAAPTKASAKS